MKSPFFSYLPVEKLVEAFANAGGNELESGKLDSPESSAALAANTFGLFLDPPKITLLFPALTRSLGQQCMLMLSTKYDFRGQVADTPG
jgi:hypothetical protein